MTAKVTIYTSSLCGFCYRAKHLLDSKNIVYDEISVDGNNDIRKQMMTITNNRTVPQIIINDRPIGGCDELYALEHKNALDPLINS